MLSTIRFLLSLQCFGLYLALVFLLHACPIPSVSDSLGEVINNTVSRGTQSNKVYKRQLRDMACEKQEVEIECLVSGTEPGLSSKALTDDEVIHETVQEDSEDFIPDVVLQVERESFFVNRELLAQFSPYFRALFFGGGQETSKRHIEIKGVVLEHFRSLMEYTQNLRLHLDRKNVLGVLETANFLQVEKARLLCCKFLERELHLSNCLGMMAYAWQLGCLELYAAAREVVLTHLPAIAFEEDFMHLPKETIADLLASDDLFVPREDLAFEVTLRWATYDPSREDDFLELAGLVRPESLSLPYITELLTKMKSSDPRAKLICKLNDHIPTSWTMGRSMPRTRSREMLFVLGGPHEQDQQSLYQFNPLSGRWQSLPSLRRKCLTQYSVAVVGTNLFLTLIVYLIYYYHCDGLWLYFRPIKSNPAPVDQYSSSIKLQLNLTAHYFCFTG